MAESNTKIILTEDGSHSLLNKEMNETYHSVHGALQESMHVFIDNGLKILPTDSKKVIKILEVGFGTGLNALLTIDYASNYPQIKVEYTTLEAFPITSEIWKQLNYGSTLKLENEFSRLHTSDWEAWQVLTDNFSVMKHQVKIQDLSLGKSTFDIVYYDAFAPSKQSEMWEIPILSKVTEALAPGGIFVTYCAKGQLKRDLRTLGLTVETLPGPPGKKEMVRATLV